MRLHTVVRSSESPYGRLQQCREVQHAIEDIPLMLTRGVHLPYSYDVCGFKFLEKLPVVRNHNY